MGFNRRERRFFPSPDIRDVYREGGAVRVELHDGPGGRQSFQFWPADLRAAATIVALLPTAHTVEIDAPAASETPTPARRISPAVWVLTVAATVVAALIAASVAFLRQGEASLQTTSTGSATASSSPSVATQAAPRASAIPVDAEALRAHAEFERLEPQMDGLKVQFLTALRTLELGTLSPEDFSKGLENWLVPQWRSLGTELAEETPPQTSVRYGMHADLTASVAVWQDALQAYAQGLRDGDNARNLAAFAQMKRAEDLEQQARHQAASLQARNADNTR